MAFTLANIKQKKLGELTKELKYKESLEIALMMDGNKGFISAFAKVNERMQAPSKLDKDSLSKSNNSADEMVSHEAMLYVIGEYLVTHWNVEDEKGEPVPINGENFVMLCGSMGTDEDNIDYITWVLEQFTNLSNEFNKQNKRVKKTRKKPSKRTGTRKNQAN